MSNVTKDLMKFFGIAVVATAILLSIPAWNIYNTVSTAKERNINSAKHFNVLAVKGGLLTQEQADAHLKAELKRIDKTFSFSNIVKMGD